MPLLFTSTLLVPQSSSPSSAALCRYNATCGSRKCLLPHLISPTSGPTDSEKAALRYKNRENYHLQKQIPRL